MFTGLISEIGFVHQLRKMGRSGKLTISGPQCARRLKPGDSVAVAGVCLTAEEINADRFSCAVITETLQRTRLGRLRVGDPVNLELAVGPEDLFGGHLVSGHIDTVGRLTRLQRSSGGEGGGGGGTISISYPRGFDKWIVNQGSIAIDGISLTVAERKPGEVKVGLIPTTWNETTISKMKAGSLVNIEFDQAIKAAGQTGLEKSSESKLSEQTLRRAGW